MSIWYTPPCTFELWTISINVSIISISLWVIGRDTVDADNICVRSALQSNCTNVENLNNGERSLRISGGQNLSFLSLFVILANNEYFVSDFVCVIQTLLILVGIVLNCLPLMKSFLLFPINEYLLVKDEIISKGQLRWRTWLAMSGFVSVGYTPQTTDICVCRRHVDNVGPTRWRHSLTLAFFSPTKLCWEIVSPTHFPTCS